MQKGQKCIWKNLANHHVFTFGPAMVTIATNLYFQNHGHSWPSFTSKFHYQVACLRCSFLLQLSSKDNMSTFHQTFKKAKKEDLFYHSNQKTIWLKGPPQLLQLLNIHPWSIFNHSSGKIAICTKIAQSCQITKITYQPIKIVKIEKSLFWQLAHQQWTKIDQIAK